MVSENTSGLASITEVHDCSLQELWRVPVNPLGIAFAFVFDELEILLGVPREIDSDVPGAFKDLGIFDPNFVTYRVSGCVCVALDDMKLTAVKIAGAVQPGFRLKVRHIDHQRISFPTAA